MYFSVSKWLLSTIKKFKKTLLKYRTYSLSVRGLARSISGHGGR